MRLALLALFAIPLVGFIILAALHREAPDVKWFRAMRRQAERGDPQMQYDLAVLYGVGKGTAKDEAAAMVWIRRAAAQGEPKSQDRLGWYYSKLGKENPSNDFEAERLFRKSAMQGWAEGQHHLACCYLDGRGVGQDNEMAVEWFKKASAQNYADSYFHLAFLSYEGRGMAKDEARGAAWLAKAAEQSHGQAQFTLGTAYATGTGVKPDYAQAYKWLALAREQGKGDQGALPELKTKMSPEQIKEGERLLLEFKSKSR